MSLDLQAAIEISNPFDSIRHVDGSDSEYWLARELMPKLGYKTWQKFTEALDRAMISCQNARNVVSQHFLPEAVKSKGRTANDFRLTRYAGYMTAMNGDPRKPEVAAAQTYFAIKTREAELAGTKPKTSAEMLVVYANQFLEQENRLKALEQANTEISDRVESVEAEQDRYQSPNGKMYSVLAFAKINKIELSGKKAAGVGAKVAAECRKREIKIEKVYDPRFGLVNIYPESILTEMSETISILGV